MSEEDKLLLKDLCGRLMHDVKIFDEQYEQDELLTTLSVENGVVLASGEFRYDNSNSTCSSLIKGLHLKPYLRPFDDITTEELNELATIIYGNDIEVLEAKREENGRFFFRIIQRRDDGKLHFIMPSIYPTHIYNIEQIDFYNRKHFDYRDLINKGLAIKTTKKEYDEFKKKYTQN